VGKKEGLKNMSISQLANTMQRINDIRELLGVERPDSGVLPIPASNQDDFKAVLQDQLDPNPNQSSSSPARPSLAPTSSLLNANMASKIEDHARQQGVSPALLKALVQTESGFNPQAVSKVGAMGLTQLMPNTAKSLGVTDPFNADQNLAGGAKYIKGLLNQYHSVPVALGAYNAGPGAVNQYGGIPPYKETQHYVKSVLQRMQQYEGDTP
jgi:soluble lytic murein transglycosylase-like protein